MLHPSKMAARSDAAATPGPKNGVFMSVSLVSSSSNCLTLFKNQKTNTQKNIYDRQSLLDTDNVYKHQLSPATTEKLQGLCLLLKPDPETAASPTDATRTKRRRRRCERGQNRGKRRGIRARLRANPTSPAIPSLMLSNIRSLENKLDLIQISPSTQHETRDCCVFVFTETWLNDNIPDSAIQLHGLSCCRADRDSSLSGKTRGGGLCVYINKEWCNNAAVLSKHCSSLVEFMVVKCFTTVKNAYKAEHPAPTSDTRILGPHLCYANPSIQTASQTGQTGSKADHGMARQCYLSTAGLLPGHRLEHV